MGHFAKKFPKVPVQSVRGGPQGIRDSPQPSRGSQRKSSHPSHRTLAHMGCFDYGELGSFSRECPRRELVNQTWLVFVTPQTKVVGASHGCGEIGHRSRECPLPETFMQSAQSGHSFGVVVPPVRYGAFGIVGGS